MVLRFLILLALVACVPDSIILPEEDEQEESMGSDVVVLAVSATGTSKQYNFSVQLESADLGCDQYADWWEVIDEDGKLLYRRNLSHSHVNEQPFSRSGGPVNVSAESIIIVRGHMNKQGYGSKIMNGSIETGFSIDSLSADFAIELEDMEPLPPKCAF